MTDKNIPTKYHTKLKTCDMNSCKGMCCYDGVYLLDGEEEYLRKIVNKYKDFFSFLPKNFIVDGSWKDVVHGRKTNVKKCDDYPKDFPAHFNKTTCVFAVDNGKCSLQILANELKIHKWTFKPNSCWLFPLNIKDGEVVPPPKSHDDDPDYYDESYPGYTTYARCGRHFEDGKIHSEVLKEEIDYLFSDTPTWSTCGMSLDEIIRKSSLK